MGLRKVVVNAYSIILEIVMWLMIIGGALFGAVLAYNYGMGQEYVALCAAGGAVGGFLLDVIVFGVLALVLDIRNILKDMRDIMKRKA
jgi:hypothetical protein